jgi:hypothetical protein
MSEKTKSTLFDSVVITRKVTLDEIKVALCTALEGGVGYWCRIDEYEYAPGTFDFDYRKDGKLNSTSNYFHPCQIVPTVEGGALKLSIAEGVAGYNSEWVPTSDVHKDYELFLRLTPKKIKTGLSVMAKFFPARFNELFPSINDKFNADQTTGDIFLQCCLFPGYVRKNKEVVFG